MFVPYHCKVPSMQGLVLSCAEGCPVTFLCRLEDRLKHYHHVYNHDTFLGEKSDPGKYLQCRFNIKAFTSIKVLKPRLWFKTGKRKRQLCLQTWICSWISRNPQSRCRLKIASRPHRRPMAEEEPKLEHGRMQSAVLTPWTVQIHWIRCGHSYFPVKIWQSFVKATSNKSAGTETIK